jgi:3-deoxy-D-manno-octulosonate 8-phosphate phosphatase (KDO 8-P phosphatase)
VFGPDDHGALNLLRDKVKIQFITADKRGFPISNKRINDEMKFDLQLVSEAERLDWLRKNTDPKNTIFMGDGLFDLPVFEHVGYSICPADGFHKTRQAADFVTQHRGGDRAVAEACLHILERFFNTTEITPKKFGVWTESAQ